MQNQRLLSFSFCGYENAPTIWTQLGYDHKSHSESSTVKLLYTTVTRVTTNTTYMIGVNKYQSPCTKRSCFFPSLVPLGITPGSKEFSISFTSSPLSLFPSPPVSYNRVGSRLSERKLDWLVKVSTWSRLDGKFSKSFPRVLELLRNWRCHRQCILDSLLHMRARVCKCYSTWSFEAYQLGSS